METSMITKSKKINQESKIDLHIHSTYSDGELTVDEIVSKAKEIGLNTIAITDHDTITGSKELLEKYSLDKEIKVLSGIELSAKFTGGRMHMLGYYMDLENSNLNDKMHELRENSVNAVINIFEKIRQVYNINFSYNDIFEIVRSEHTIGRPDIAKLFIKYGYVDTVQKAFDDYLIPIREMFTVTKRGIPPKDAIELILEADGIPTLAHPGTLKRSKAELIELVRELVSYGLKGIEVYHSDNSLEDIEFYKYIASKFNLLCSGGTDYHGPIVKPNILLGTGINNNIKIKELSLLKK